MPELPEVETVVRGLAQTITGDVIESVWAGDKPEPFKTPAPEIAAVLPGARIAAVRRSGKHIVFDLEPAEAKKKNALTIRAHFLVHLGMTGRLVVVSPRAELAKHTHLIVYLQSRRELRFVDARRFGRLAIVMEAFEPPGAEPLDASEETFTNLFRGRKTPIKSALLNQKLLSGIGNIYADESLFRAGIRPRRRAARLRRDELKKLHDAIREVLQEAIAAGGSSVSDYVNSAGERGFFQFSHRVYGREGDPCLVCSTPIQRLVLAGRSAHYCPQCQK